MFERKVNNMGVKQGANNKCRCSICGEAGAEKRILPDAKAIEYVVKGARKPSTTRGAVLVCDKCFAKIRRDNRFACEVTGNNQIIEYR